MSIKLTITFQEFSLTEVISHSEFLALIVADRYLIFLDIAEMGKKQESDINIGITFLWKHEGIVINKINI